jgi:hypothetical protein
MQCQINQWKDSNWWFYFFSQYGIEKHSFQSLQFVIIRMKINFTSTHWEVQFSNSDQVSEVSYEACEQIIVF